MPIGEFGGAPPLAAEGSPVLTTPMYWMYEMAHASLNPARAVTDATKLLFQNPLNPWARTEVGKSVAAACELFERTTRRYGKPEWGLNDTEVNGIRVPVEIRSVWEKPFCRLLYFDRKFARPLRSPQPRVLIVAPMSGHYATLLRGTVEAFLPAHVPETIEDGLCHLLAPGGLLVGQDEQQIDVGFGCHQAAAVAAGRDHRHARDRRERRRGIPGLARRPGRLRDPLAAARRQGDRLRLFCGRDHPDHHSRRQGRPHHCRQGRASASRDHAGRPRQAEADRAQSGHRHRRQRLRRQ